MEIVEKPNDVPQIVTKEGTDVSDKTVEKENQCENEQIIDSRKEISSSDEESKKVSAKTEKKPGNISTIKEKKTAENEHKAKHETEDAAIDAVCKETSIDIPSGMIEAETESKSINEYIDYIKYYIKETKLAY